jgi:CBS domain-containing protein
VWQFGSIAERWLGVGMLAQAGVAVGFAHQLGESWGAQGKKLEALILAAVLVFEMIGPILTRAALVHGGEVPVLALLSRGAPVGVFEGMHEVIGHIRLALGIPVWRKSNNPAHVLVRHVMRRNVETARDNLPFAKVLQLLGHTRYDRIPVLDASGRLVGQICYADVAGILFDDALSSLVVARDLMTPAPITLATDDTLDKALRVFAASPDVTYVPVVDGADPKRLLGIVRQNDVLAACRRQ